MGSPRRQTIAAVVASVERDGTLRETLIGLNSPEWRALLGWCHLHRLDARRIPAGSRIVCDLAEGVVRYDRLILAEGGGFLQHNGRTVSEEVVVEYGPRLQPFPPLIRRWLAPAPRL